MSEAPIERRRDPRAQAQFSLQLSTAAEARPAVLKDISRSGMCCYFGEPMTEMTILGIRFELPGSAGAHAVKGVVVRCEKRRGVSPPSYEIAVYFTELEPESRLAIQSYVLDQIEANLSSRDSGARQ